MGERIIQNVLVSVWDKECLLKFAEIFKNSDCTIYATEGTYKKLAELGIKATPLETLTGFKNILGGRIKTLNTNVFAGILANLSQEGDINELKANNIPFFDLIFVDPYPFQEFVRGNWSDSNLIEMIDIGGISLLRAGAKNFKFVLPVPGKHFLPFLDEIKNNGFVSTFEQRKKMAAITFFLTAQYDEIISTYFLANDHSKDNPYIPIKRLRYGENPHQKAFLLGFIENWISIVHAPREISYNNLQDIASAIELINDLNKISNGECISAIIKHTNPCGVGIASSTISSIEKAIKCDPISAYGGIFIANFPIEEKEAIYLQKIVLDIVISPELSESAKNIFSKSKKKIVVKYNFQECHLNSWETKKLFNCFLLQEKDLSTERIEDFQIICGNSNLEKYKKDIEYGWATVKNMKSNAIAIFKDGMLIGGASGSTSRIDALKEAIRKAREREHNMADAILLSDAFFPFLDSIILANENNIKVVVEPGGSIRDPEKVDYCKKNNITLIFTGKRHFKH